MYVLANAAGKIVVRLEETTFVSAVREATMILMNVSQYVLFTPIDNISGVFETASGNLTLTTDDHAQWVAKQRGGVH